MKKLSQQNILIALAASGAVMLTTAATAWLRNRNKSVADVATDAADTATETISDVSASSTKAAQDALSRRPPMGAA